jgi:hypothetical protein
MKDKINNVSRCYLVGSVLALTAVFSPYDLSAQQTVRSQAYENELKKNEKFIVEFKQVPERLSIR